MPSDKFKNTKILIVDDEPSRKLMAKTLKTMGITHIIEASDGKTAISKLYLNQIEAIKTGPTPSVGEINFCVTLNEY